MSCATKCLAPAIRRLPPLKVNPNDARKGIYGIPQTDVFKTFDFDASQAAMLILDPGMKPAAPKGYSKLSYASLSHLSVTSIVVLDEATLVHHFHSFRELHE